MGNNLHRKSQQQQEIKDELKEQQERNNILFLGQESTGKTTFLHHIQLLDNNNSILKKYQTIYVFRYLLEILIYTLKIIKKANYGFVEKIIKNYIPFEEVYNEYKKEFTTDNILKKLNKKKYKYPNTLGSQNNIEYLLRNRERILLKKEVTELDFLSAYSKTASFVKYENLQKKLIYLSGRLSNQGSMWKNSLENNVSTVIIFVSLSDFDLYSEKEDNEENRLKESLFMYRDIVFSKYFHNCNFLLCFTKVDDFARKIRNGIKMSQYFKEFKGNNNSVREVFEFIVEMFKEKFNEEKEFKYCALNVLDKYEVRIVKEIIETFNNNINQQLRSELFVSQEIYLEYKDLCKMFMKLLQSISTNERFCDIDLNTQS